MGQVNFQMRGSIISRSHVRQCANLSNEFMCRQMTNEGEWESVDSPQIERPPLRHIDKYVRPELPCCDMSKRFTVAILASVGEYIVK